MLPLSAPALPSKRFILVIILCFWLPIQISAQVIAQDSLALVALYQSTDGDHWTNNTNWLTPGQNVSTWYGITLNEDRVWEISLSDNNLTGALPEETGDLTGLYTLMLDQNHLSGTIPLSMRNMHRMFFLDLSANDYQGDIPSQFFNMPLPDGVGGTPRVLLFSQNKFSGIAPWNGVFEYVRELTLESNQLDFGDLETTFPNSFLYFSYSPQLPIYSEDDVTVSGNAIITLKSTTAGSANHYQWFKDGIPISGASQATYSTAITLTDEGAYTAAVTNDIVTDLTLERNVITLHVEKDSTYTSCNGLSIILNASVSDPQATYHWSTGATTPSLSVSASGKYGVQVETENYILKDTMEVVIHPKLSLGPDIDTCDPTKSLSSNISTADTYTWYLPGGSTTNEVTHNAQVSGRYVLEIHSGECIQKDTVNVLLDRAATGDFDITTGSQTIQDNGIGLTGGALKLINTSPDASAFDWSFGDNATASIANPVHTFNAAGQYTITLHGTDSRDCPFTVQKNIEVKNISITNAISPNGDGKNDQLYIEPLIYSATLRVVNRWGQEVYNSTDYHDDFTGANLENGVYYYELRFKDIDKSYQGNIHIIK